MKTAAGVLLGAGSAGLVASAILAVTVPGVLAAKRAAAIVAAMASAALGVAGGAGVFGVAARWDFFSAYALGHGGFQLDRLGGLFLLLLGAAGAPLLAATTGGSAERAARLPAALRPLLVLAVVSVFLFDNVFLFLVAWEVSVLLIFALVGVRFRAPSASRAAALTLTLGKLGGAAVFTGLLLLGARAGTFSFAGLAIEGPGLSSTVRGVCFVLLFVGFGVKAAIVPVQTWLPGAYGETNSESAGVLAAVALNLAFYGMLRTWFGFLGVPAVWWAVVALVVGAITALLGILGGILQRRLRTFVAYSSIENSGLIVAAMGIALMGAAHHETGLVGLGLVAATFQIAAHTIAKAGLFTAVAAVERSADTSDMDRLGGLYRALPWAAFGALFGAAALAALPPFSGFASEWLIFEGLMQGFRVPGTGAHVAMALTGASLALTAGLAALAFVRALGMTFLGMPRADIVPQPEPRVRKAALAALGLGSLALGVAAPWVVEILEQGTADIGGTAAFGRIAQPDWLVEPGYPGFASISPTVLAITLLGFAAGFWVLRALLRARVDTRVVPVWASGVIAHGSREQYTAGGYANMARVIFNVVYRVHPQLQAHGDERFPERLTVVRDEPRIFDPGWLYRPITRPLLWVADRLRYVQAGYLALYLLYLLGAVLVVLVIAPRV
ncbi:MAG TPA: proton-conducting transporter membrane subunit [Solirubrobacteraceae bacterium]|jgi:formate hydrogenlyase subunit 3/multisubunit Na+/H+ antiporter MnhD subunit